MVETLERQNEVAAIREVQKDDLAGAGDEGGGSGKGRTRTFSGGGPLSHADMATQVFGGKIVDKLWKEFSLDEKEIAIMATLFNSLLDGEMSMKTTRLLSKAFSKQEIMSNLFKLSRLAEKRLITVSVTRTNWGEDRMINFIDSKVSLTDEFLRYITLGTTERSVKAAPYKSDEEMLNDIKKMGEMLEELSDPRGKLMRDGNITEVEARSIFDEFMGLMQKRIELTGKSLPITSFINEQKLDPKEAMIVLLILYKECLQNDIAEVSWLLPRISRSPMDQVSNMNYFSSDSRLIRNGIITVKSVEHPFRKNEAVVRLDKDVMKELMPARAPQNAEKRGRMNKLEELVKEGEFFELLAPVQSLEGVILPASTSKILNEVEAQIKTGVWKTLQKWGISHQPAGGRERKKDSHAATILFYGPPGTGKTHAALAIAGALKKQIVTVDCSKVLGKYVGESEKNTRKIFDEYRRVCDGAKNHPILLLNEADQFFQRRLEAQRSTDRMYNQMQNILLEEMEKFRGMLIATTNLMDNFDPAFSRRFHYKIKFERPGKDERERLWRLHLPEGVPLSSDIDLKAVADAFDLSGGQIALVVKNAAVRAAIRDEGDRYIMQEDLILSCEEEVRGNFDQKAKMAVGF